MSEGVASGTFIEIGSMGLEWQVRWIDCFRDEAWRVNELFAARCGSSLQRNLQATALGRICRGHGKKPAGFRKNMWPEDLQIGS